MKFRSHALILVALSAATSVSFAQTADRDRDGVPDALDLCPGQAGPASNGGCPVEGAAKPAAKAPAAPGKSEFETEADIALGGFNPAAPKAVSPSTALALVALQAAPFVEIGFVVGGKATPMRAPRTVFALQVADLTREIEKSPRAAPLYARRALSWSRVPDLTSPRGEITASWWPAFQADMAKARELAPRDAAVLVACLDAINSATRRAEWDAERLSGPKSQSGANGPGLQIAQNAIPVLSELKKSLETELQALDVKAFAGWKMSDLLPKFTRTSVAKMGEVRDELSKTYLLAAFEPDVQLQWAMAQRYEAAYAEVFSKGTAARVKTQVEPFFENVGRAHPQLAHDLMSRAARLFARQTPELALEMQTRAAALPGVKIGADNRFTAWKLAKTRNFDALEAILPDLDPFVETEFSGYELPELATRLGLERRRLGQFAPARRAFETAAKWGGQPGLWLEAGDMAYRSNDFRAAGAFYETFALSKGDVVSNRWIAGRLAPAPQIVPVSLEIGLMNALAGANPAQTAAYVAALAKTDAVAVRAHRQLVEFHARQAPDNATLPVVLKALDARLQNTAASANGFPVVALSGRDFDADAPFRLNGPLSSWAPQKPIAWSDEAPFNNKAAPDRDDFLTSSFESLTGERPFPGVRSVQEGWSVDLKAEQEKPKVALRGRYWLLAPSFWAREIKRLDAVIAANPTDSKALAQRAAAWSMAYGSILSPGDAKKVNGGAMLNKSRVEADLAEVWKRPLTEELLASVLFARRVERYGPSEMDVYLKNADGIRQTGEQLQALDATLAQFAAVSPLAAQQRAHLLGKTTLAALALDVKNEGAQARAEKFLGAARSVVAQAGDKSPMNLWIVAVESARGTFAGDLGAQIQAIGAKMGDAELSSLICAELSRMISSLGQSERARVWAAAATELAGAKPSPLVLWARLRSAAQITDADIPALREAATKLSIFDRDKDMALAFLARESQKRGQLAWQLRALENALILGAPPARWGQYARVALEARQWGNAFNANRLALGWQEPARAVGNTGQINMADLLGDAPAAAPNEQTVMRLEGAFAMHKLGRKRMAERELGSTLEDATKAAKAGKPESFVMALEAHTRFLMLELETTPEDGQLKKIIDQIAAAKTAMIAK